MLDWRKSANYVRARFAGVFGAVCFHAAMLVWLFNFHGEVTAQTTVQTISVSLITPPQVKALAPQPEPKPVETPKPRVQPRPKSPPVIAVAESAPTNYVVPVTPPEPPPVPAPVAAAPAPAPYVAPVIDAAHLHNPKPVYPQMSRRQGEEGKVMLRVLIGADGNAEEVRVSRSSGFERLDRSALDAVKKWKFVPARRGETPIAEWWDVPVSFTLEQA